MAKKESLKMPNPDKPKVGIIDYGLGNLFSIERAVRYIGAEPVITDKSETLTSCDCLILPGVGAFADAMEGLRKKNLIVFIKEAARSGMPLMGICLGMQLLMSSSEEFGLHQGLDLIKGRVVRMHDTEVDGYPLKIPHIGWNGLHSPHGGNQWQDSVLEGLEQGVNMYFVHSYIVIADVPCITANTQYGKDDFCSCLESANIVGCQFHPERSGEAGLSIYRNFVFKHFHKNFARNQQRNKHV